MAEYLIQDSTLISISNEIRTLRSSSSTMTPASMTSNLKTANSEVNSQTEIIEQILAALETKGDGGLNFTVVGGTTQPSNPIENTIWVNTDIKITSWEFSATQPIGSAGKVWISIGTYSNVGFNMLKDGNFQVYPRYAKQYISETWVDVTAKSYQNSSWIDWNGIIYLFKNGDQCENVTGGWDSTTSSKGTINANNNMYFSTASGNSSYKNLLGTQKSLSRDECNTLYVEVVSLNNKGGCNILATKEKENTATDIFAVITPQNVGICSVDISGVSENFYVSAYSYYPSEYMEISNIWIE